MVKNNFIIGIDPSTSSTGYAIFCIETEKIVTVGKIEAKADNPMEFYKLEKELKNIFKEYNIIKVGCETQFIGINKETSIKTIRPTGVVLSVCGFNKIDIDSFKFFYPSSWRKIFHAPLSAKFTKKDTFNYVKSIYPEYVKTFNKDNDISDAIGIATATFRYYNEESS